MAAYLEEVVRAELYRVAHVGPGVLSIAARPRGGDWLADELETWREAGADIAASLLAPADQVELDMDDEAALCQREQIMFRAFPLTDRDIPADPTLADVFIDELVQAFCTGKHISIHCRIGIVRSAMIAVAILVAMGETPERAFACIEAARGLAVPDTPEQQQWVEDYAARRRPS